MLAKIIGRMKKKRDADLENDEMVIDDAERTLDEIAGPSGLSVEAPVPRPLGPLAPSEIIGEANEVADPTLPRVEDIQQEEERSQDDVYSTESSQDAHSDHEESAEVELEMREFKRKPNETLKLAYVYAVCRSKREEYPLLDWDCHKDVERSKTFLIVGMRRFTQAINVHEDMMNSPSTIEQREKYNRKLEKALKYFTAAVASAPQDSQELAQAYRYRAQVLMSTHDFVEALVDLHRCVGPNTPTDERINTFRLRAECCRPLQMLISRREMSAVTAEEMTPSLERSFAHRRSPAHARLSLYRRRAALATRAAYQGIRGFMRLVSSEVPSSSTMYTVTRESDNLTPDGGPNEIDIEYNRNETKETNVSGVTRGTIASDKLFSTSSNVCLKYKFSIPDTTMYLSASSKIDSGALVISARAYASMLDVKYFESHCSHCSLRSRNLFPCHNCSLVMYCCNGCRISSWAKYHEIECQYLAHMMSANRPRDEMLALRVLMVLTRQGEHLESMMMNKLSPFTRTGFKNMDDAAGLEDYETILKILIPFNEIDTRAQYDRYKATLYLLQMLKQTTYFRHVQEEFPAYSPTLLDEKMTNRDTFAALLLHKCLWVARFSSHPIIGSKNRVSAESSELHPSRQLHIGDAVYPILTLNLLKHSCRSNVAIINFKNEAHLYATKPIKPGKALTYSFGCPYFDTDKQLRIDIIKDIYCKTAFWSCTCKACKEDWKCEPELPKYFPKYKHLRDMDRRVFDDLRYMKRVFHKLWKFRLEEEAHEEAVMKVYRYSLFLHKYVKEEFRDFAQCQIFIERSLNFQMDETLINFLEERENETVFRFVKTEEI